MSEIPDYGVGDLVILVKPYNKLFEKQELFVVRRIDEEMGDYYTSATPIINRGMKINLNNYFILSWRYKKAEVGK